MKYKLVILLAFAIQIADPGDQSTIKPNLCFRDSFEINRHKDTVFLNVAKGDIVSISFKTNGVQPDILIDGGNGDKRPYSVHCEESNSECSLIFIYQYAKDIYKNLVTLELNPSTSISYRMKLKEKMEKKEESACTEEQMKKIVGGSPTAICVLVKGVPERRCKPGYRGKNCEMDDVQQRLKRVAGDDEEENNILDLIKCENEYRIVNAKTTSIAFLESTMVAAAPTHPSGSHLQREKTKDKGKHFWKTIFSTSVDTLLLYMLCLLVILTVAYSLMKDARRFFHPRADEDRPRDVEMVPLNPVQV